MINSALPARDVSRGPINTPTHIGAAIACYTRSAPCDREREEQLCRARGRSQSACERRWIPQTQTPNNTKTVENWSWHTQKRGAAFHYWFNQRANPPLQQTPLSHTCHKLCPHLLPRVRKPRETILTSLSTGSVRHPAAYTPGHKTGYRVSDAKAIADAKAQRVSRANEHI